MSTFTRRKMLLAVSAVPVSMLISGYSFASARKLSVGEAMRYLCEDIFPSAHQKRHESSDGVVAHWRHAECDLAMRPVAASRME
jgi:hypothetical protein